MGFPIPKLALACLLNLPGKKNAIGTIKMLKTFKIPKKRFFLAMELNNSILLRYTTTTVLKRSFNTLK